MIKTVYSLDCSTAVWRIAQLQCEESVAHQPTKILSLPVPIVLKNFVASGGYLPVAMLLNQEGNLESYGQDVYQKNTHNLSFKYQFYEGLNLGSDKTEKAFHLTQLLMSEVLKQLHQERPTSHECLYIFSYPDCWGQNLVQKFQSLIKSCFLQNSSYELKFIPASYGLVLGLRNANLIPKIAEKSTLIIDFGGGTLNFIYGSPLHQDFTNLNSVYYPCEGWFEREIIADFADRFGLDISSEHSIIPPLKKYVYQFKERLNSNSSELQVIQQTMSLELSSGQILTQDIQLAPIDLKPLVQNSMQKLESTISHFLSTYLSLEEIGLVILTGSEANSYFLNQSLKQILVGEIPIRQCPHPDKVLVFGTALWYVKDLLNLTSSPSNITQAQIYQQTAITQIKEQDYQNALNALDQAIALNPDYREAYFNRSQVKYQIQDYQGAIADLEVVIAMNPDDAYPYYRLGSNLFTQGNYRGAITNHSQALNRNPHLVEAYWERGVCLYYLGDIESAKADITQALLLSPKLVKNELKELKQRTRSGLFNFRRNEQVNDLIKFVEYLLQGLGLNSKQGNFAERFTQSLDKVLNSIPLEPETVNVLTYKSAVDFFVTERPVNQEFRKGALLRQKNAKGYLITQVFLDGNQELVCRPDGVPMGRKLIAKNLDNELLDFFGKTNLIILE